MDMYMDKLPLYIKLAETLEKNIDNGKWKHGDKIPSERELCESYGMSRITVRNAVMELVNKNKLEKLQGRGTFVRVESIKQHLESVYSFSKEMEKQGKISSTVLLDKKVIKADSTVASELGINENDQVVYIERLRCANDQSIMLEKTYFAESQFGFVMDIDLNTQPLYQTLELNYGILIDKAVESFKAVELTPYECKLLNAKKNHCGLIVKRRSFSNNKVICYSTIKAKGDIFEFTVTLGF